MNKFITFLLSGVLVVGAVGCQNPEKTSSEAPNNTNESPTAPAQETTANNQNDAQNQIRKNQLNSDIRANEQRNRSAEKSADALKTEVRDKLEANIPKSNLTVDADDKGIVTVGGNVPNQPDLAKIPGLVKQIKGVNGVTVKATVAKPVNKEKGQ